MAQEASACWTAVDLSKHLHLAEHLEATDRARRWYLRRPTTGHLGATNPQERRKTKARHLVNSSNCEHLLPREPPESREHHGFPLLRPSPTTGNPIVIARKGDQLWKMVVKG